MAHSVSRATTAGRPCMVGPISSSRGAASRPYWPLICPWQPSVRSGRRGPTTRPQRGAFPGMILSRRNYDVAQGYDGRRQLRSGVLEQSWRIGGASGAEIAALEAFRANPALEVVRASTMEIYGDRDPPPHATVYFRGVDEEVGPMTKYAMAEPHDDA